MYLRRITSIVCIACGLTLLASGVAAVRAAAPASQSARGASAPDGPPRTVDGVDFDRYVGTWYELARLPNRFQDDCTGHVTATYSRLDVRKLRVVNRCRTADGESVAEGIARPAGKGATGQLEVRFAPAWLSFLPFVWGDYWILALADDYSTAVVGSPDREYLWLLSRTPSVSVETYDALVAEAGARGYRVDRLQRTPQS